MATLLYFTSYKSISYSTLLLLPIESAFHSSRTTYFRTHQDAPGSLYTDQGGISSLCHSIRLVSSLPCILAPLESLEPTSFLRYSIPTELITSVLKSDRSISDCIKNRQDLPARCQHLITSFTDCKRGMVSLHLGLMFSSYWASGVARVELTSQLDMRRRFRGNHISDQEKLGERGSAGVVGNVEISPDSPEKR